jgi:hypothetical protein
MAAVELALTWKNRSPVEFPEIADKNDAYCLFSMVTRDLSEIVFPRESDGFIICSMVQS